MSFEFCNCGKPVRYTLTEHGVVTGSCNKYKVCPTYDELLQNLDKMAIYRDIAMKLAVYREHTEPYKNAIKQLKELEGEEDDARTIVANELGYLVEASDSLVENYNQNEDLK